MSFLPRRLEQSGVVAQLLAQLPASVGCWLVGGALRDDMLGVDSRDFDFALDIDPTEVARGVARELGGTFVALDPKRRQSRVVVGEGSSGARLAFDFAPLRAGTLLEDLTLRDFTCNALACDLRQPDRVIDPLGGEGDLSGGLLRPCSPGVLADDPLRILKGIRHATELGMVPTDGFYAEALACRAALAAGTASERIKLELGKIFVHPHVRRSVPLFERTGVWGAFCDSHGDSVRGDLSALDHVLHAEMEFATRSWRSHLARVVDPPWDLAALVRFHRYLAKDAVSSRGFLFKRLRFSRRAESLLRVLEDLVGSTCQWPSPDASRRGRGVWLDCFQPSPPAAALFLASLLRPGCNDVLEVFADWLSCQADGSVPHLVPAQELMSTFGIVPGPVLGRVLDAIRAAEVSGRISSTFDVAAVVGACMKKD